MATDTERVTAFLEKGTGYSLGEPPRWHLDFGGADYDVTFDVATGVLSGTLRFPNRKGRHSSSGFHFGGAGQTAARLYGEEAYDEALRIFARAHHADIVARIAEEATMMRALPLSENDKADWKMAGPPEVTVEVGDEIVVGPWERSLPVTATIRAVLRKLPDVVVAPFATMSDRELDAFIYEDMGPEGVSCDGEIPRSRIAARMRQLRERYRALSPRRQTEMYSRTQW